MDGHKELGAWNSQAVKAIQILDRIKVNWEGNGNDLLFVIYLHMGMGKINWREEGDLTINRIYKIENLFYVGDSFSVPFFWRMFFPIVGCRLG
jgi:hypothetical protein